MLPANDFGAYAYAKEPACKFGGLSRNQVGTKSAQSVLSHAFLQVDPSRTAGEQVVAPGLRFLLTTPGARLVVSR